MLSKMRKIVPQISGDKFKERAEKEWTRPLEFVMTCISNEYNRNFDLTFVLISNSNYIIKIIRFLCRSW
jgi:hypothetical protein